MYYQHLYSEKVIHITFRYHLHCKCEATYYALIQTRMSVLSVGHVSVSCGESQVRAWTLANTCYQRQSTL